MTDCCGTVFKTVLFIVLLTIFVFQVTDQVEKFFARKTSMSVSFVNNATLETPAITLCTNPPFQTNTEHGFLFNNYYAYTSVEGDHFPKNVSR